MNRIRILIAVVGLSLAAFLVAQQTTNSSSTSRSGGGQASASSSASGSSRSSGSKSAGASANGSGSGFQGKATHVIFFNMSQDSDSSSASASDKAFQQEARYMADQQVKGKVLMFGPWRDQPGAMALVLAQNDSEAEQIAKNDPAVRSGNMTYEVRAWNVR